MSAKLNIKKDDKVMVTAGRDRGKVGKVLRVMPAKNRAIVEKVNVVKRHTRPSQTSQGGIVEKEMPIDVSNLMVICDKCGKASRLGRKVLDDGKTSRFCKKCGELLDA